MAALLLFASLPLLAAAARTEVLFNAGWLFHEGDLPWTCSSPASASTFPINTTATIVHGLADAPAGVGSAADCAAVCAGDCACQAWQFCQNQVAPGVCAAAAAAAAAPIAVAACSNSPASFPVDMSGIQCSGLNEASAHDEASCAAACCASSSCSLYQWCPPGSGGGACGPASSCWIGTISGTCQPETGWVSRARNVTLGATCQVGLLADYGPGNWQTTNAAHWVGAARLAPPAPPPQASGPGSSGFDDSGWEALQLPHDYLARGTPTDVNAVPHQNEHGSIPFANAWYRKHFSVPSSTVMARLYFDGAYRSASIFLNGALVAQHEEGYTGFSVWLHNATVPLLVGGGDNVVAVYLAATIYTYELWGYEGAGIQRDVTLVLHDGAVSIAPWGVVAGATVTGAVSAAAGACGAQTAPALVAPTVDAANAGAAAASLRLTATVVAPDGSVAGASSVDAVLPPGGWARLAPPPVAVAAAALWTPACAPDAPRRPLYTLATTLVDTASGSVLDAVNTTFGVRNVTFDANGGLFVNGFYTKIRGFSMHQDYAGTGTWVPPNIQKYRIQRVLDIGGNAWRTAHNPVDSNLLAETDARGLLVWSEARFLRDAAQYVADAGDMVARDRNHPSIILYSLCNENGCGEQAGWEGATSPNVQAGAMLATRYMAHMKTLDATRPITANAHNTLGQPGSILGVVDVMGLTYDQGDLDKMHAAAPGVPLLNGESASCQSDRGDDDASGVIACSQSSWAPADARVWDAGAFVWSGFDYRGETSWPSVVSYYGVLDLCGFDKPVADWYKIWWGAAAGWPSAATAVAATPAWAPPAGGVGAAVKITAIAAAAAVELRVNGALVGARVPVARLGFATWTAPYAPGNYSVSSFDGSGALLGTFVSTSPGPAAALRAVIDWPGSGPNGSLIADRRDAALVAIAVVDAAGVVVRGARANITFTVTGPGELLGLGNGDHQNHLPGQADPVSRSMPTYDGLARAILRGAAAAKGAPLRLTMSAPGLTGAAVEIDVV